MDSFFSDMQDLLPMSGGKSVKNMEEARNYLFLDLENIARLLKPYNPLEILKTLAWEERRMLHRPSKDPLNAFTASLLPVVVQSVLQSTLYDVSSGVSPNRNVKKKDLQRIASLNNDIVRRLLRYIDSCTVLRVKDGQIAKDEAERYRLALFSQFFPSQPSLEDVDRLGYVWYEYLHDNGWTANPAETVTGLRNIVRRGITGFDQLSEEATLFRAEVMLEVARKRSAPAFKDSKEEDLREMVIKEQHWEGRRARIQGERDGYDLFRPDFAADLPEAMYDAMSCAMGSLDMNSFFDVGLWPSTVYPFFNFGSMRFSFTAAHILTYEDRFFRFTLRKEREDDQIIENLCSKLFSQSSPGTYNYYGKTLHLVCLPSIATVNALTEPELYSKRIEERSHLKKIVPDGRQRLLVDPDSLEDLQDIGGGLHRCSLSALVKAAYKPKEKRTFLTDLFDIDLDDAGQTLPAEVTEYLDEDEYDEPEPEEAAGEEEGAIAEDWETGPEDEDEAARLREDDSYEPEEAATPNWDQGKREEEIRRLQEKYAITDDILQKEKQAEVLAEELEKVLDDDEDLIETKSEENLPLSDADDDSSSQLDFLDELFASDPETQEEEEGALRQEAEEEPGREILEEDMSEEEEAGEEEDSPDLFDTIMDNLLDEELRKEEAKAEKELLEQEAVKAGVYASGTDEESAAPETDLETSDDDFGIAYGSDGTDEPSSDDLFEDALLEPAEESPRVQEATEPMGSESELFADETVSQEESANPDVSLEEVAEETASDTEEEAAEETSATDDDREEPESSVTLSEENPDTVAAKTEMPEETAGFEGAAPGPVEETSNAQATAESDGSEMPEPAEEIPAGETGADIEKEKAQEESSESYSAGRESPEEPCGQEDEDSEDRSESGEAVSRLAEERSCAQESAGSEESEEPGQLPEEVPETEEAASDTQAKASAEIEAADESTVPEEDSEPSVTLSEDVEAEMPEEPSESVVPDSAEEHPYAQKTAEPEEPHAPDGQENREAYSEAEPELPETTLAEEREKSEDSVFDTEEKAADTGEEASAADAVAEESGDNAVPEEELAIEAGRSAEPEPEVIAIDLGSVPERYEPEEDKEPEENQEADSGEGVAESPEPDTVNDGESPESLSREEAPVEEEPPEEESIDSAPGATPEVRTEDLASPSAQDIMLGVRQVEADSYAGKVFVMTDSDRLFPEEEERQRKIRELPFMIRKVVNMLDNADGVFTQFAINSEQEFMGCLEDTVRKLWERQQADGKDKIFSIRGNSISIILARNSQIDKIRRDELLNNVGAVMYSRGESSWTAIMLGIDSSYQLSYAKEYPISPSAFSPANWKVCQIVGEQLKLRRK